MTALGAWCKSSRLTLQFRSHESLLADSSKPDGLSRMESRICVYLFGYADTETSATKLKNFIESFDDIIKSKIIKNVSVEKSINSQSIT
jgi:hypothetical protein